MDTEAPLGEGTSEATFRELQARVMRHYGMEGRSRYVTLAEPPLRAHLIESGQGDPVITLHGGDGNAVDWAPLIAELQSSLHVFAVDRPGYGLTDPFDYRDVDMRKHVASFVGSLLDALGLESATLAGGSMGGYFAMVAALAEPERINRLILLGFPLGLVPTLPDSMVSVATDPETFTAFMEGVATVEGRKRQYAEMFSVDVTKIPDLYFEMSAAGLNRPGALQTHVTCVGNAVRHDGSVDPQFYLGDELGQIRQPTLVIWGERDWQGAAIGKESTERLGDGRFMVVPDIGHFPFLEAPEVCAKAILQFVQS
jgi:pimeloyl-ACP methyl ester carboxylesterase